MVPPITIVEAPSILGLRPTGVAELPDALRAARLYERLGAGDIVRVSPGAYDDRRDAATGFLNPGALVEFTYRLADALAQVLDRGHRPLVLGGDCTIVLGTLLALAGRGRHGLLFFDGHADFYQPEANVNGEAASSELALATGRGPAVLTTFGGRSPLIQDGDVVAIGMRDGDEARSCGSQPLPAGMPAYDLAAVRRMTPTSIIDAALAHLRGRAVDGHWIHFDVDVLDDEVMPAVDYRLPGGLSWSEAETMLTRAWSSGAVGMDVTIFNPRLDRDGSCAQLLAGMIARTLTS